MKDRLPSVCFVTFVVEGLLVTYQLDPDIETAPPETDSQTLVEPTIKCPHPPGTPAAAQSSPPEMPPWKRSYGTMNDLVSPVQPPVTPDHPAPAAVQLPVQRAIPPLLSPWKKRRPEPVPRGSILE